VLHCAHGNKETISHLNSQKNFGVRIDFAPHEKGCVKSDEIGAQVQSLEKEG